MTALVVNNPSEDQVEIEKGDSYIVGPDIHDWETYYKLLVKYTKI